jgi:hypothetical protein
VRATLPEPVPRRLWIELQVPTSPTPENSRVG